jgi:hypothetical protein
MNSVFKENLIEELTSRFEEDENMSLVSSLGKRPCRQNSEDKSLEKRECLSVLRGCEEVSFRVRISQNKTGYLTCSHNLQSLMKNKNVRPLVQNY